MPGSLVLVATPIGNLGDMSQRAIDTLKAADVIACEDSRHTQKLLNHFDIHVKTMSLHQHNERERIDQLIERIRGGETVALVTDAGMPAISDPGEVIVAAVAQVGLPVTAIPGASAVVMALALSGLPTQRFVFEGFLPRKGSERRERMAEIAAERRTTVLYESPHRVQDTVDDLVDVCGIGRRVSFLRELTKIHEEVWRGRLADLQTYLDGEVKGECVLVLEGAPLVAREITDDVIVDALAAQRAQGMSKKGAVEAVSILLQVPRNRVYDLSLK